MDKEAVFLALVAAKELEIDSEGRIWRLAKRGGRPDRGSFATRPCERVRAEYPQRDGYLLITTTVNGVKTVTGAHRVVWSHFNKRPIPPGLTINHKDKSGDKADNRPGNLEVATYSEQRKHALEVLKVNRHHPIGSLHPKTHITEVDVIEIRRLRESGVMVKEIASKFDMNPKAISAICCQRTWKHI